jgi:hypothetical protein
MELSCTGAINTVDRLMITRCALADLEMNIKIKMMKRKKENDTSFFIAMGV